MKKTNKITLFLLSVLCCLCFTATAFAGETVNVQKMNMYITMPDGWVVFNLPLDESDSSFDIYDYQTISQYMKDAQRECVAINESTGDSIEIYIYESSDIYNLKEIEEYISDEELSEIFMSENDGNRSMEIEGEQATVSFKSIYNSPNNKYLIYEGNETTHNAMWYTTAVNGNFIHTYYYDGDSQPLDQNQQATLKNVVDSITFNQINETPKEYIDEYKDLSTSNLSNYLYKAFVGLSFGAVVGLIILIINLLSIRASKKDNENQQQ